MLTDEEIRQIREKMKKTHFTAATLGAMFGVTRQQVGCVLNRTCTSKNISEKLRKWLNEK